jgi:hypothetical protein
MTAVFLLVIGSAVANLPLSSFDAGDGNLVVNDEAKDWANIGIDCPPGSVKGCGLDKPTGQTDDSFGQGTKEDTPAPVVVDGSIPNNKSDLLRFYVANERENNKEFLYLAWERVQEPNGTTNMDFEFNKRQCTPGGSDPDCSANGLTPIRSEGDVLIKYDLAQGGVNPVLGFHRWVTSGDPAQVCEANNSVPCWGKVQSLGGNFEGSINQAGNNPPAGVVVDPIAPNAPRNLSTRTFGEAAINLTDSLILPSNTCASFGSAYLKSRSSDSFTAALKDFIAPIPVNISNCGKIIVRKVTDPSPDPSDPDASFGFTLTGGPSNLNQSFSLSNGQSHDSGDLFAGNGYAAAEVNVPSGWTLLGGTCDDGSPVGNIDVSVGETVTCTFTNQARGNIIVEKVTSDGSGAFNFTSGTLTPSAFTLTTTAAGAAGKDSKSFLSLSPGTYDVAETVPAGWNNTSATCDDGSAPGSIGLSAGETVTCTFVNAREKGAILITKTRKHAASGAGNHPHQGVTFTVTGGELPAGGVTVVTDALGQGCVGGLVLSSFAGVGNYTVTETVPDGYSGEAAKIVTVDNEAACADDPYLGESVSFLNTPLTDLSVSVDSQVPGGTSSDIECKLGSTVVGSAGPGDDLNLDLEDLEPGVYVCTVDIDP